MAAKWYSKFIGERRSSLENPQTPLTFPTEWLLDLFNGGRTDSGVRVSEMTAMQVGTVYACVNIVSGAFASLPLTVFERLMAQDRPSGKTVAFDHNLWEVLHNEPNPEMTAFQFRKTLMVHDLLWGNAYAEIQRNNANQIVALWPRNPAKTRAIRLVQPMKIEGTTYVPGTLLFETTEDLMGDGPRGAENFEKNRRLILAEDMVHVPGLAFDGRVGQNTVYLARQILGLALATEKYGAKFFGNGARPAGVLTYPGTLEDKAIETLRKSWAEAHGGENAFKVAVLEQGVDFKKIAATPEEGQMLATRQYQRTEICAIFNVPLHMIAASEKGGKSQTEQSSIEFVLYCLNPWVTAYEQELERKLFPKIGRSANKFFPKFDVRRLLYPSAEARAAFYQSGKQNGYLNSDDIREFEDLNPIAGGQGKIYTVQTNMQNAEVLLKMKELPAALAPPAPEPVAGPRQDNRVVPKKGTPSQPAGNKKKPVKKAKATRSEDEPDEDLFSKEQA